MVAHVEYPDYDLEEDNCALFFQNFAAAEGDEENMEVDGPALKYLAQLADIANRKTRILDIDMDDVRKYVEKSMNTTLLANIERNAKRYVKIFASAADKLMPEPTVQNLAEDVFDIIAKQRAEHEARFRQQRAAGMEREEAPAEPGAGVIHEKLPPELMRRYEVRLKPGASVAVKPLRQVNSADVGRLVRIRGIVTNITDVKPLMSVATYLDETAGMEFYQEVTGKTFTPLAVNPLKNHQGELKLLTVGSKFVKFQEAKIQEAADEVPQGSTPRTMTVQLRGELTRSMKPGDDVVVGGIFLPEPYVGYRAMRSGLISATFLEATHVEQQKKSYADQVLTDADRTAIETIRGDGEVYTRLARSIAPNIWGHEDVKKALLLAMVGGVTKNLPDGMKLRGDVHLCLMGDPGVAKSQLLKYLSNVSPRAVYTTGKGSSGVGLTAAVTRDRVTGEMVLEGGALVLADRGIACIDEFDKMQESDRTAIHEVMEQQTVSIAKAGITTTLNTRTTLVAAANPAWGRYDKRKTPSDNINMPAALLSRFDVLWLLIDEVDKPNDLKLAEHVLTVHATGAPPPLDEAAPLTTKQLRAYIAMAKQYEPVVDDPALERYIATKYASLRKEEQVKGAVNQGTYTTARTLLAVLRLSQALAKLRFDNRVIQADVDEALELMRLSKASLADEVEERTRKVDPLTGAYHALSLARHRKGQAAFGWDAIRNVTRGVAGLTDELLEQCLREYAELEIWATGVDARGRMTIEFFPTEEEL